MRRRSVNTFLVCAVIIFAQVLAATANLVVKTKNGEFLQVVEAQNKGAIGVICASSTIGIAIGTVAIAVLKISILAVGGYMQYRMNNREAASSVNITVIEVGYVIYGANAGADLLTQLAADNLIASISILPDSMS